MELWCFSHFCAIFHAIEAKFLIFGHDFVNFLLRISHFCHLEMVFRWFLVVWKRFERFLSLFIIILINFLCLSYKLINFRGLRAVFHVLTSNLMKVNMKHNFSWRFGVKKCKNASKTRQDEVIKRKNWKNDDWEQKTAKTDRNHQKPWKRIQKWKMHIGMQKSLPTCKILIFLLKSTSIGPFLSQFSTILSHFLHDWINFLLRIGHFWAQNGRIGRFWGQLASEGPNWGRGGFRGGARTDLPRGPPGTVHRRHFWGFYSGHNRTCVGAFRRRFFNFSGPNCHFRGFRTLFCKFSIGRQKSRFFDRIGAIFDRIASIWSNFSSVWRHFSTVLTRFFIDWAKKIEILNFFIVCNNFLCFRSKTDVFVTFHWFFTFWSSFACFCKLALLSV